ALAIEAARQHGVAMVAAVGGVMQGSARAMGEPRGKTAGEIRVGVAAYGATGARLRSTQHLTLLAQALSSRGRHEEGLDALRAAATMVEETGERYFEAEIHRLEGNLLLTGNRAVEADACYARALEVARAQQARALELRATCDLARLWAKRGERAR